MNFRQPPAPKRGLRRYLRMLSLLVLQHALAPGNTNAHARSRLPENPDANPAREMESRPYLRVAALSSLRFKALPPPAELSGRPAAGAPPQPVATTAATEPHSLNPMTETASTGADPTGTLPNSPPSVSVAATTSLQEILPDDTRPATRPEDFLPFFQLPGATHDVTVLVPVAPTPPTMRSQLPPSSATYQQK